MIRFENLISLNNRIPGESSSRGSLFISSRAAVVVFSGQFPPAASAIATRGSQQSVPRTATLRFVKASLTLAGYEVITTTSGEQGLQLAETGKPDVILLDLLLSPLTSFDVLESPRPYCRVLRYRFHAKKRCGRTGAQKRSGRLHCETISARIVGEQDRGSLER